MEKENIPLIRVENLKKYYPVKGGIITHTTGYVKAVDGVSFSVMRGQTLGLVGESGCGKSTIGRQLVGLETPTEGKIYYDGVDLAALQKDRKKMREVRTRLQMIFQDPYSSLNPRKHIFEILSQPMLYHKISEKGTVEKDILKILDMVGLPRSVLGRYPHEFSGGMRQRVMIAMAIVCNPKLIIADEPTTALDVTVQAQVLGLMQDLQKKTNTSIILVTHNLGVVWKMCDNVMVMYAGKTVEYADVKTLYKDAQHPYTWGLLRSMPKITDDPSVPLASIPGTPPDLKLTGGSCNFYNRCKYCQKICKTECPPMREASPGHLVACHFTAEELKKIGGEEGD